MSETPEIQMDASNLYHEELFTDQQTGTLRRMTPVTTDGSVDSSRPVLFVGQAQIMTPMGALPISFPIEADNLADAVAAYGAAAQAGIEKTARDLEEMRREQASQIVMPGAGAGNKIQMP